MDYELISSPLSRLKGAYSRLYNPGAERGPGLIRYAVILPRLSPTGPAGHTPVSEELYLFRVYLVRRRVTDRYPAVSSLQDQALLSSFGIYRGQKELHATPGELV